MQLTFCDHCKQEIHRSEGDLIFLRVGDRASAYDDPDRLDRSLELHRQCYLDHYRTTIDQANELRTDTDPLPWG